LGYVCLSVVNLLLKHNNCNKTFGYLPESVPNTHKWQVDDGKIISEESPTLCFIQPKTYYIKHSFKDSAGKTITLSQNVQILNNVDKIAGVTPARDNFSNFYLYPNPSTGLFTIKSKKTIKAIKIVNLLGQPIFEDGNINLNNFDNNSLINSANGIYNVIVTFSDLSVYNFKVIKV